MYAHQAIKQNANLIIILRTILGHHKTAPAVILSSSVFVSRLEIRSAPLHPGILVKTDTCKMRTNLLFLVSVWLAYHVAAFQSPSINHRLRPASLPRRNVASKGILQDPSFVVKPGSHLSVDQSLSPPTRNISSRKHILSNLWTRCDTLRAAGLSNEKACSQAASIGLLGHTGLLLTSVILVKTIYQLFIVKKAETDEEPQPAGIMNRCPWPFIFFHAPMQGLKDSSTWVAVTWIALCRISKWVAVKA